MSLTVSGSQIDDTVPADNVKVDKALLRANNRVAKEEITILIRMSRLPWQIATGNISL